MRPEEMTPPALLKALIGCVKGCTPFQIHFLLSVLRKYARVTDEGIWKLRVTAALVIAKEVGLQQSSVFAHLMEQPVLKGVVTKEEVRDQFGEDTAELLAHLLRVADLYESSPVVTTENFDHFLLSIAEDVRVVLILLGRRLNLLRQCETYLSEEDRVKLAIECSYLHAPIAHRLGLYVLKSEMEDLALKYTDPETYEFITAKLRDSKEARDAYVREFIDPVRKRLDGLGLTYTIKGRTKSISSISNKLKKKKLPFEEIYDIFAIRVVLDVPLEEERSRCWQVYSVITDMYQPNPERMKDWISIPKSNGYESLHITVMGPEKRWVEVQIRTRRMDEVAERGLAAHWRYKGIRSESGLDEFMTNVRSLLENKEGEKREDVIADFRMSLYDEEIYVFTPKGELRKLPKGATVLDFAYAIHSRVGSQTVSAKVNGINVSIKQELKNGDTVEILTSKNQQPKPDWLNFVLTGRARSKIKAALRAQNEEVIRMVREEVLRRFKNRKMPFDEGDFGKFARKIGFNRLSSFYLSIHNGRTDLNAVLDRYKAELEERVKGDTSNHETVSANQYVAETLPEKIAHDKSSEVLKIDKNLSGIAYQFAKCCNPIYGDKIFAFTSSKGMKIHRMDCPNAHELFSRFGYRVLQAEWVTSSEKKGYEVALRVVGLDDVSVVNNISSQISSEKEVTLRSFRVDSNDGLFVGYFYVFVKNAGALTTLIKKIRDAKGVKQVTRLN
ncbi:MAG: TGS domain-containing protein [Bacteroidales bacterium]|nr:TGS domain-containing protein [Bacteroidales bacterium]